MTVRRSLVPDDFVVPAEAIIGGLRLELLGPRHNVADHAAWTSSIAHIRATPGFGRGWPPAAGMTLAENLADLRGHAERSASGVDFAYTVIDVATEEIVGCVYVDPPSTADTDVDASSWVRASRAELDEPLTEAVGRWLLEAWPFAAVRYRRGKQPAVLRTPPT